MSTSPKRALQLDVLRAIAILLVIGRHIELARPDGAIGFFSKMWFTSVWLGVDLFFVLSGFLIGGLLLTEHQKHGAVDVSRFLIRRGLKIYPPYFVFIAYLILMPIAKAVAGGGDPGQTLATQWSLYWPNLRLRDRFFPSRTGTMPLTPAHAYAGTGHAAPDEKAVPATV